MKRNITTTIEFSRGHLRLVCLESFANTDVIIFSERSEMSKAREFIGSSLREVETLIGGKVREINVVIDDARNIESKISLARVSMILPTGIVTQADIDNIINLATKQQELPNRKIILAQPLAYDVESTLRKSYSKAPIDKKGEKISATVSITTIDAKVYNFIVSLVESHGLSVVNTLLRSQALSHNNLSENALANGASLIHIDSNKTFCTINKNYFSAGVLNLFDAGFKKLLTAISKSFNCSTEEAYNLLVIHGDLYPTNDRVIHTSNEGFREVERTLFELSQTIKVYLKNIVIVIAKYLSQKNLESIPVVLSGKLNKVNGVQRFIAENSNLNISLYSPMTFIEIDESSHCAIGYSLFLERINIVSGNAHRTIVETNPNMLASGDTKRIKLFRKFKNKIGGKYEWN